MGSAVLWKHKFAFLIGITGIAASAHAAIVPFGAFLDTVANQWKYNTGALTASAAKGTFISFASSDQILNYTGPVTYDVSALASGPAVENAGLISQTMAGTIEFTHGATTVLDISFVGAILTGTDGSLSSGVTGDTMITGQVIGYNSDPGILIGSFSLPFSFSVSLTQTPGMSIINGNLSNFTATATGTFAADQGSPAGSAPEPATLALLGIAGTPLLLRRRARLR